MFRDLTFCQFFFKRETRKLIEREMLETSSSWVSPTCPTATERQRTWKIIVIDCFYVFSNLLHLEFDGSADLVRLALERLSVGDNGRELSGLVKSWTEDTWDLLDQGLGGDKSIVALGELLDKLLVLVQLLQVISAHRWDVSGGSLVNVVLVSEHAHLHGWTWDVLQSEKQIFCIGQYFLTSKFIPELASSLYSYAMSAESLPKYLRPWVGVRQDATSRLPV